MKRGEQTQQPPPFPFWWSIAIAAGIGFLIWLAVREKRADASLVAAVLPTPPAPLVSPWNPLP